MHVLRVAVFVGSATASAPTGDDLGELWTAFKATHGKLYVDSIKEQERFKIFEANVGYIKSENAKNHSYALGITFFADLTFEEARTMYTGVLASSLENDRSIVGEHAWAGDELPESVDWTQQGAVTPIKDQGQCGSCWSFAAIASLEGANFIANGELVSLSEQQMIGCAASTTGDGCHGGFSEDAFDYAKTRGVCTEASLPYPDVHSALGCQDQDCTIGLPKNLIQGYTAVAPNSEAALMSAVAQQPVAVCVDAGAAWFLYDGGVLSGDCATACEHMVTVVGYGSDLKGGDYWRIKNSWGKGWGRQGYILLARGKGGQGECGILNRPVYPLVSRSDEPIVA